MQANKVKEGDTVSFNKKKDAARFLVTSRKGFVITVVDCDRPSGKEMTADISMIARIFNA